MSEAKSVSVGTFIAERLVAEKSACPRREIKGAIPQSILTLPEQFCRSIPA
jgi:hypothetical protein